MLNAQLNDVKDKKSVKYFYFWPFLKIDFQVNILSRLENFSLNNILTSQRVEHECFKYSYIGNEFKYFLYLFLYKILF